MGLADHQALQALVRATSTPQGVAQRARIILRATAPDAYSARQVAQELGVHHTTVWTILDEAVVKPHKQAMWLNSRDPDFTVKQQAITDLYR